MLGSAAQISNLRPYPPPTPYIAVDAMPVVPAFGPKHLLFSTPGNLYVLPAGFTVVNTPPPADQRDRGDDGFQRKPRRGYRRPAVRAEHTDLV